MDVELTIAAAWHSFLNKAAHEVLVEWGDCVDRIVYRHTMIPCMSVWLTSDSFELVRQQALWMSEGHWRNVMD